MKFLYLLPFVLNITLSHSSSNCKSLFNDLNALKPITTPTSEKPSKAQIYYSMISSASAKVLFQQMQKDAQDFPIIKKGFFSQILIQPDGSLKPINDPTITTMDAGDVVADRYNKTPHIRQIFIEVYKKAKSLEQALNQIIPEADIGISEVVFTFQYKKPSEGWHSDWYENEYIIVTQTFTAQKINQQGILTNEPNGGTEYFILDNNSAASIQYDVHKTPVETVKIHGHSYTTPTDLLSIHSGTQRIKDLLGESFQYSISPPHRGAQTPMEFRGSLAVRYSKKSDK